MADMDDEMERAGALKTRRVGLVEVSYLEDIGPQDAASEEPLPILLWLHGGYVTHREWEPQREHFQGKPWRSVYVDLPGHGASSRCVDRYDVELFARDMLEFLRGIEGASDPRTPVICIGHSLGGMIAQAMARIEPGAFSALILADTTYSTQSTLRETVETQLARLTFRFLSVERLARMSAKELGSRRPDVGPMIYREMMAHARDRRGFLKLLEAVFSFDSRPWLRRLRLPVLLIVAEENKGTMRQVKGFVQMIPHLEFELIYKAGHMLNWDQPEAFNQAVEHYVERIIEAQQQALAR